MNVIFDLDGTLIDSKDRLYQLFIFLANDHITTFDEYWGYKFSGLSNADILKQKFNATEDDIESFIANWMNLIEEEEWLNKDSLINGVEAYLSNLANSASLYVCTARQSEELAINQLKKLELPGYFRKIMVTNQKREKTELILENIPNLKPEDWMIGDTGKDVLTGKELGLKTCAVLSGFMSKQKLAEYKPDIIISDITNFKL